MMTELPLAFSERMRALLGPDWVAFEARFEQQPRRAFHLNRLLIGPEGFEALIDFDCEALPSFPGAYAAGAEGLGRHPLHHAGMYYVQEPSAMCVPAAAEIGRGFRMLDLCAAPGGKASLLAMAAPEGLVLANDPVMSRCRVLTQNVERMGYANMMTACLDPAAIAAACPAAFDLTLVDAPCSGEGMFRKEPEALAQWSPGLVERCAARQAGILKSAARTVREGGYLLYSTCTYAPEENELAVTRFLKQHTDFTLVPCREEVARLSSPGVPVPGCEGIDVSLMRRFYPFGPLRGEGQFLALMRRTGGAGRADCQSGGRERLTPAQRQTVTGFLRDTLSGLDEEAVFRRGDSFCFFQPDFLPKLPLFSCGVRLGGIEKGSFRPAHQLFSALGRQFFRQIDLPLDDPRLRAYLRGETFADEAAPEGWAAVLACGAPLGGAKKVSGTVKNHYPKGLRAV